MESDERYGGWWYYTCRLVSGRLEVYWFDFLYGVLCLVCISLVIYMVSCVLFMYDVS